MGLGTSKRKFISNDEIDRISSSNKTLEKLYSYIKGYDGYITKRDFELIFNKKLSTKISNKLYKIFSTEKDKFFFDDLKYFYALMLTKLVQPKIHFFSELIFGEKSIKHVDRYTYRVGLIFPQEWKNKLTSKEFISKICDKGNTNKISKENFIKFMGSFYDIPLASFEFLKNFNLSNANKNNFRKFDKHKISFACDCYSQLDSKSSLKSFNDLNDFIYDKMETEFRRMEKLNDGLFTIQMFDKILTDLEVNSKLISPISLYLKRKTQRNFIDFKTLKMFLLSFIGGADARIKILFQVLSFPKEYIDKKVLFALIKSLLPNNSDEYISLLKDSFDSFQDKIFWDKFLTLFTQNTILYQILNYLDRINYIPYLYFKVRPEDKLDQKGCIEILTKGEKDLKKVIETLISNDNENDFYCVNYEFWETWCNYVQWDVNCKEVNPETNHVKTLKISNEKILGKFSGQINKDLIYFKDFVVFPSKIYEIFTRWYAISGSELKVKKICYKSFENLNQKNLSLNENNLNNDKNLLLFKKNERILEIDLYPIFSKHFTFDELLKNINEISIDATKALLKNLYESNLNLSRILQFSRKTYFKDIKTQLEVLSKINKPTNLWVFYKSEFYKCDENKTLEEDNIEDFCLLVLENYKDNEWCSEFISRMSKKNSMLEQENLIKEQQSTNTNKIPQPQPVPLSIGNTSTSTKESNNYSSQYKNKTSVGYIDPSLIGIQNIGNTCYMNSVLQSLLNLDIIQRVFMNKNFKYFINYKNKFGFKGRLIREFVNLISEKWSDSEKSVKSLRPVQFKEIVGEINPQFKNKDQQDAQEFISFLLDVLHEEINLNSEKEYIANPEMYDYTEEELATEYWANNMRRNVSFVHSIFLGQMKSTLECEACGSNKISFETFSNLILPIPQKKTINLEVVFFRLPFTYKAYYIDKFIDKNLHANYNSNFSGEINVKKSLNNIRKNSLEVNEILTQEEFEPNEKYLKMKGDRVKDSSNILGENLYTSKLTTAIPLKLVLNIDRKSKVEKVISMLKEIKELELEVNNFNNGNDHENEKNQSNTTESKFCNTNKKYSQRENKNNSPPNYTTYVIMSGTDNTFIDQDLKIDECFQNDQLIYIYELLNTYGINKIINSEKDSNSISEVHKKRKNSQDNGFNISNYESNTCLTQNKTNYSSTSVSVISRPIELGLLTQKYPSPDLDPQEFGKFIPLNYDSINKFYKSNLLERQLNENYMEYLVQILHRYPIETKDAYLFRKESFIRLEGFLNILLLNNFTNFTARYLYDYIWEKYEYILNDPTKVKSNLWWVNGEKEYSSSKKEKYIKEENIEYFESSKISNSNGLEYKDEDKDYLKSKNFSLNVDKLKMCNPFVIKILNKENNACIRCPWYNFCTGCILDPLSYPDAPLLISPSSIIVVEWCHQIVKKEMNENNLRLILNHESVRSKEEEKKSKSLEECLDLFLEKEYLEEENQMIHCSRCKTSRNFFKKYDFDRMPPVLILNIKRFKFAKMYKKKIDNLIEFPIYDLELKGFKYDLYSVINHSGVLSAGHYTSITKINNKWIKCDDASCYEVEENSIVSSGAYILIYKLKESIETDYLKMMNSLLNNFDFHDLNNLKNPQTFYYRNKNNFAGEPVKTPYGRGFIQKEILFENNKNYCVKFRYGSGYLK